MTGPRPAGRPWTLTDDDMLRKLLASGMKSRQIAQKLKRSIGAIQSRIFLFKKPRKRLSVKRPTDFG
jgi:transposase